MYLGCGKPWKRLGSMPSWSGRAMTDGPVARVGRGWRCRVSNISFCVYFQSQNWLNPSLGEHYGYPIATSCARERVARPSEVVVAYARSRTDRVRRPMSDVKLASCRITLTLTLRLSGTYALLFKSQPRGASHLCSRYALCLGSREIAVTSRYKPLRTVRDLVLEITL